MKKAPLHAPGLRPLAALLCCSWILSTLSAWGEIDFNTQVRPILSNTCFRCHGPDEAERKADLRLDTETRAVADLGGTRAVVPGQADASELIRRVSTQDPDDLMPPPEAGDRLTEAQIGVLKQWIEEGAVYQRHWAYEKPVRPSVPLENAAQGEWAHPVDAFVAERLAAEGLDFSAEADRASFIRRVTLDLTGLPPTPDEVDAFVADERPTAYRRLLDRLLASPGFGEHWARMWLDLARYADSSGYADDPPRTIWAYRDYVIRAFNANLPFDRFTIEQIAGDLLPESTKAQLVATAFHRNTQTNNEGGTSDEEFRNVAVVDRVNTTMQVWMGTTMSCAQCHTHKYDPITQEDYFKMFAVLNNTADADRTDESPTLAMFTDEQRRQRRVWEDKIAALETELKSLVAILAVPAGERSPDQWAALQNHIIGILPPAVATWKRIETLRKKVESIEPETTVPVMKELADQERRQTFLQYRGSFLDTGPEVSPGVPEALHALPEEVAPDRMVLARWLVSEDNPLTGRVLVNRFWEKLFGAGLVTTSEEFGSQGELPSHPELLDWLAVDFVESGWDVKRHLASLVSSRTYRQSSKVTPDLLERDPVNRWLARGPRFRLSAEMVRDQALAVSGLLSAKMFGPPVKPPQPTMGVTAAFGGGIDWQTSEGEDRYRRGIYTMWRRSNPYPSMAAFDAPNREVCTVRRDRTNTPLQAFVTLNDPVYVEAAQSLARRMNGDGRSAKKSVDIGFRLCLGREPDPEELRRLVRLYEEAVEDFRGNPDKAEKMATIPLGPAPASADLPELAALSVVANVLLNLDEMLMKR